MKFVIVLMAVAPALLAWGVTGQVCGFWTPREINCYHASDGYWELYSSLLIAFCIAIWVGGGLGLAFMRLRRYDAARKEDMP